MGQHGRDSRWLGAAAMTVMAVMACATDPTQAGAPTQTGVPTPPPAVQTTDPTPGPSRGGSGASAEEPNDLVHGVIVDLAVDWRPEHELGDDELAAQRQRIQQAEDAVTEALGAHGRVRRQLHATAQVSLAVDDEGLRILQELAAVAAVHEDTADPAN